MWDLGILSASDSKKLGQPSPSPTINIGICNFVSFRLRSNSWKVGQTLSQTPAPPLPPPHQYINMGLSNFVSFGLRNRSWKVGQPAKNMRPSNFVNFGLGNKSWKVGHPPPPPPQMGFDNFLSFGLGNDFGNCNGRGPFGAPLLGAPPFSCFTYQHRIFIAQTFPNELTSTRTYFSYSLK